MPHSWPDWVSAFESVLLVASAALAVTFARRAATAGSMVRSLLEREATLTALAATDSLTGVANRRRFDEMLDQEWRRAVRGQNWLSVLLIDVDHFKTYNDRYGHPVGDVCLRAIAAAIAGNVRRPGDLVARYGGEEFAVILPGTDPAGAHEMAERVREAVADLGLASGDVDGGCVTASVGVGCAMPTRGVDQAALVTAADTGLYLAKRSGRNRTAAGPVRDPSDKIVRLPLAGRRAVI